MTRTIDLTYITSAFVFAIAIAKSVNQIYASEKRISPKYKKYPRYLSFISGSFFPLFMLIFIGLNLMLDGMSVTIHKTISMLFSTFLHVSFFYILLIPLIPRLRKEYDARACAMLWVLPNFLYYATYGHLKRDEPIFVLRLPGNAHMYLFVIWFIGFISIMAWKIISHLRFRSYILKDAQVIADEDILKIWNLELIHANISNRTYTLVRSKNVKTPLSIGLFKHSICVVLPERDYTEDELMLVFRHEIIHICREDGWSKFSLIFFTAMCWFNPLMWIAMRKSAEDMELSCDESVLQDADDQTRHEYASLILNNASDERGFTTCLSAAAKSIQYRLKNIVKHEERLAGGFLIGLTFFVLFMTYGYVGLAYDDLRGSDVLFHSYSTDDYILMDITKSDDNLVYVNAYDIPYESVHECLDDKLLKDYLKDLSLERLTGNYSFINYNQNQHYIISYKTPNGSLIINLYEDILYIQTSENNNFSSKYYYLAEGTDWEELKNVIFSYPTLNVQVFHTEVSGKTFVTQPMPVNLNSLYKVSGPDSKIIYTTDVSGDSTGFQVSEPYKIKLSFMNQSMFDYTVKVETWDQKSSYTIPQSELEEPFKFIPASYPAHYTIKARFKGPNDSIYEAEFKFDISKTDE